MKDYQPISCSHYDFLEIACLDRYEVHLFLTDGQETKGLATDLKIRDSVEYLLIKTDDDQIQEIRVDLIRQLDVLTQPRRFSSHIFQTS